MISYIRMLVALARPAALFLFASFATLGLGVAGQAENHFLLAKVLVAVTGFVLMSVVVNDLADERIDRINFAGDTRRPLAAGTGTRTVFRVIAVSSGGVAVAAGALLGAASLAVVVAGITLSLAYSLRPLRLSDRGAVASLLLPFGYVAVPFLCALFAAGAAFTAAASLVLGGLYVGFIGRMLLKDFRDVRGDALFGKRTFVVRYGRRVTCAVSAGCTVAGNLALIGVTGRTPLLVVMQLALAAAVLALVHRLATPGGARRDEWTISAIAIVTRGMLMTLFGHYALLQASVGAALYTFVLTGLAVATVGQAHAMVTTGPRRGVVVPAEWSVDEVLAGRR